MDGCNLVSDPFFLNTTVFLNNIFLFFSAQNAQTANELKANVLKANVLKGEELLGEGYLVTHSTPHLLSL